MELYDRQLVSEKFDVEVHRSYSKKHGTIYHKYCNDILTFDIEVTSAWLENGEVIGYEKGKDADYWNNLTALSLPYIWQFSFNEKVYYGREFNDFKKVLDDLPKDIEIVIWVHNLSYEFHFLTNILHWKKVFARSPHKPMKAVPEEYPNIEFRCSYMLTRLSLDSWGKQLGTHKMTGDLDYEKIRTPLTPLTETEMGYCQRDCEVVYAGIKDYRNRYGNIRDIPLTQTGTVRRVVKDLLMEDDEYRRFIKKLIPEDTEEYKMLMEIFAGGYTHANRRYSGMVQKGLIEHYDFASSYPTVMVAEKYPMGKWIYLSKYFELSKMDIDNYAYILQLKFTNLECQTFNTYIQASKCDGHHFNLDNGRVISADDCEMYMTEQDWLTIQETYTWDTVEVLGVWHSRKDYLPKKFVEYILQLYKNKTTLKGVEGKEDLYMQSKQYINSMFGMCVTAIVQPDVKFHDNEWIVNELTEEYVQKRLDGLRKFHPRERRYFLSYSWGCWVTAYARRNLWKCIEKVDSKVLYCDTDSIFVKDKQDFSWYNKEVTEKLRVACEVQGIDFEMTHPKTPKGKEKPLGIFDKEDDCIEFITLGAKRYVERREEDKKLHLTVSGINKEAVALLNDNINNFKDGFDFNKDADCVHKQLGTYLTDMPPVQYPDGYVSNYKDGINLRRTGYLLTMTDEYKALINYLNLSTGDLEDAVIIRLKGMF